MNDKIRKKLKSRSGESIGETLVALLISALALVMLAAAISAASGIVIRSRTKLDDYYKANETIVIQMTAGGTSGSITIKDESGSIADQSKDVTYYKNDEFGKKTVIAYKLN